MFFWYHGNNYLRNIALAEYIIEHNITSIPLETLIELIEIHFIRASAYGVFITKQRLSNQFSALIVDLDISSLLQMPLLIILKDNSSLLKVSSIKKMKAEVFSTHASVQSDFIGVYQPLLFLVLWHYYKASTYDRSKILIPIHFIKNRTLTEFSQDRFERLFNPLVLFCSNELDPKKRKRGQNTARKMDPRKEFLQPLNKNYLSFMSAYENKVKLQSFIYCPICAKEFLGKRRVLEIDGENVIFQCDHMDTIYEQYEQFSIPLNHFGSNIDHVDSKTLKTCFRRNVQPIRTDDKDYVHLLSQDMPAKLIKLHQYLKTEIITKKEVLQIIEKNERFTVIFNCPICDKEHHMKMNDDDHDIVMPGFEESNFIDYRKLITVKGTRVELECLHKNTSYQSFEKFSIPLQNNSNDTLKYHALQISKKYYAAYVNQDKVIVNVLESGDKRIFSLKEFE